MDDRPRFRVERLQWEDELLASIELPRAALRLVESFGSGLARRAGDPADQIWAVGDRGPNLKVETLVTRYGADHLAHLCTLPGAKVMPRPDLGPRIARLRIGKDRVELAASHPVMIAPGEPISGLPMPGSEHAVNEPALSMDGERIRDDPSGIDSEGLVALEDGSFILSEEFGPSLVRLDGNARVLGRFVPENIEVAGASYPVHQTLPAIASRRQLNRGFEAISLSADQKWLLVAFQSPLAHPDEATHQKARHVRLWRLDIGAMQVVAQYLYPLDPPQSFLRDNADQAIDWSDLKISELVATPDGRHLVLERGSATTKIYRILLGDAFALPAEHLDVDTRPTIEELSAEGQPLIALEKELLFSSDDAPEMSPDLEGMVVLSPSGILLVNDNDFGCEGAATSFWRLTFAEPILG